jgi:hypothetical protein
VNLDGRWFFVHIYIDVQNVIGKFQLKEILPNPFIKIIILRQMIIMLQMYSKRLLHHFYLHQFHNIMID